MLGISHSSQPNAPLIKQTSCMCNILCKGHSCITMQGFSALVGPPRDERTVKAPHCRCQVSDWQSRATRATDAAAEARTRENASAQQLASLQTKLCEGSALAEVRTPSDLFNTLAHLKVVSQSVDTA